MENNLETKIEAVLFFKGEPVSRKKLADILNADQTEINEGIEKLKENLQNRGVVLIENDDEITLGTAPEISKLVEHLQKEELNRELSKASLETLAIVLYKDGVLTILVPREYSFQMQAESQKWLAEINKKLKKDEIKRIRFRVDN